MARQKLKPIIFGLFLAILCLAGFALSPEYTRWSEGGHVNPSVD